jgi:hypothetical protein
LIDRPAAPVLPWPRPRALLPALVASLFCAFGAHPGHAAALRYCDPPMALEAPQKDRLLRFGALVKAELEQSGQGLALIARSGLDLSRFNQRYSHAGFSLKANPNAPWSVRQLYYACEERKPRLFDQGIAGFLLGTDDPSIGYVSLVFLPGERSSLLERAALDNRQALRLLGATYSANAYPFDPRYQNCNQWVAELLAVAWGLQADEAQADDARVRAQAWLKTAGYVPTPIQVTSRALMFAGGFVPWLHSDDHPIDDVAQMLYRVSMPASIEAFVQTQVPGAQRVEFCHTERQIVVHRGWDAIAEGCQPGPQDTVIPFD